MNKKNTTSLKLRSTSNTNVWSLLIKAPESAKIAGLYGFSAVVGPKLNKTDNDFRSALLREMSEAKGIPLPQPFMLWTKNLNSKQSVNRIDCTLSILGSSKSVTEVLIIQSARAILEHAGWKNIVVKVNAVGNKESIADFERKMSAFIRKHFNEFPAELRQSLKKDSLYLARSEEEKYKEWREASPQSIDCLSEESRLHFKEVLEFLESLGIPYVVTGGMLPDLSIATETAFEIYSEGEKGEMLAQGLRYNRLSKKLQHKKEIPAVEIVISCKTLKAQKMVVIKENKPKFYLVQFGPEAKLKCLTVLEKLRKSGIQVFHSLAKDKLTGQILTAEQMNIPYVLLLGQKEALENSIIVRNAINRSQTTVPIENLAEYIKNNVK